MQPSRWRSSGSTRIGRHRSVLAAIERLGCPALTTYQAIGVVPEGHPQQAGLFTSGVDRGVVARSRPISILAIGFDQVEPMPTAWRYDVPVVAVSEVAASATLAPIPIEVIGPARHDARPGRRRRSAPDGTATRVPPRSPKPGACWPAPRTGAFGPLELAAAVVAAAPAQAIATVDAGAHFLAIMPFWPAVEPLQLLISNGLATMGLRCRRRSLPPWRDPGRPVVCMVGDGGLAMTLAELETLARLQLPVTVVVFDDAALSLIEVKQKPGQGGSAAVRFAPVDYAQVASAMGLDSVVVSTAAEAAAALARRLGSPASDRRAHRSGVVCTADRRHPRLTSTRVRAIGADTYTRPRAIRAMGV